MIIEPYPPMLPTRPCRSCFALQGGAVFADFDVDPDGAAFLVRISFDGYGCCTAPADVTRLPVADLARPDALRAYFRANRDRLWPDALAAHDLL